MEKDVGGKQAQVATVEVDESVLDNPDLQQIADRNYDAHGDKLDMWRLGKKQELKRRFRYLSIAGFIVVMGLTWPWAIVTSIFGLANGGTGGTIWVSFGVIAGMFFNNLTLAEVTSMAPTAGGLYHWVSELASPRYQKSLSYVVGWLSVLSWQTGVVAGAYIMAQHTVALIVLCKPDFVIQGWHNACFSIAWTFVSLVFCVATTKQAAPLQILGSVLYCIGFVVFITIFWALGPKIDADEVFLTVTDDSGWGSTGIASLVGLVGPVATFIGGDSGIHVAEELQDAAYVLPRAMVTASLVNYAIGFIALVSFLCNIPDLETALDSSTGQPWIEVVLQITKSRAAAIVLVIVIMMSFFWGLLNLIISSSRQLFAFARDKGLPFHAFLSRVTKDGVPMNSLAVTMILACLLSLIMIGSTSAFGIIISLSSVTCFGTYAIIAILVLERRLTGTALLPRKFDLGRYGTAINLITLAFDILVFVFLFFPGSPHPDLESMNWASVMFVGVLAISYAWYLLKARHEYDGPVEYVRKAM